MSVLFFLMGSKAVAPSIIFLFVTWYLDEAAQGVDVPWTTFILALNIYILASRYDDDIEVK